MNGFETCLLLVVIPAGLIAAGYGLVRGLREVSSAERLAAAMLAGLSAIVWTVSVVNLALPLSGVWGWLCVLPLFAPLARGEARRELIADVAATFGNRRGAAVAVAAAGFLAALLWPLLSRPDVVFYDGTSGHDAFFWIVGAEHLKRHNYLQPAVTNPVYPLYYSIESIAGLKPAWGRMGAEGLLALMSNLAGASPLKIYVAATAALFFPWLAAVLLVGRTFVFGRIGTWGAVALVALQPVFIFFHANANLPNLLGVLAGALVVVATARSLDPAASPRSWLLLLVLGVHALLCTYPEMIPPIALIGALLVLRAWRGAGLRAGAARVTRVGLAVALGLAINPITALRAWSGLSGTLAAVAHVEEHASIFDSVALAARAPAMVTLSVSFGRVVGAAGGALCSAVLLVAAVAVIRRARDRFGAIAMLAGGAAVLAYTWVTGYSYGWQKTVQFAAVFVVALVPCGIVVGAGELRAKPGRWRVVAWPVLGATAALFAGATAANFHHAYRWSERKFLTREWFAAREFSRKELRNVPVKVETQTFARPFFHTMWAAYFLDESRVYFTHDKVGGGYLWPWVESHPPEWVEAPRAAFVAHSAAEAPGTTVLWRGGTITLVRRAGSGALAGKL